MRWKATTVGGANTRNKRKKHEIMFSLPYSRPSNANAYGLTSACCQTDNGCRYKFFFVLSHTHGTTHSHTYAAHWRRQNNIRTNISVSFPKNWIPHTSQWMWWAGGTEKRMVPKSFVCVVSMGFTILHIAPGKWTSDRICSIACVRACASLCVCLYYWVKCIITLNDIPMCVLLLAYRNPKRGEKNIPLSIRMQEIIDEGRYEWYRHTLRTDNTRIIYWYWGILYVWNGSPDGTLYTSSPCLCIAPICRRPTNQSQDCHTCIVRKSSPSNVSIWIFRVRKKKICKLKMSKNKVGITEGARADKSFSTRLWFLRNFSSDLSKLGDLTSGNCVEWYKVSKPESASRPLIDRLGKAGAKTHSTSNKPQMIIASLITIQIIPH